MRERSRPRSGRPDVVEAVRRAPRRRPGTTSQRLRIRLGASTRGTSTTLNYILLLGIVSILVTALVAGFGGLVDGQQDRAVRSQLEVVGNRVAGDVGQVDTLATRAPGYDQSVRIDLPSRVVGASYTLTVDHEGGDDYLLTLSTGDPKTTIAVPFRSTTPVAEGTIHGGSLVVKYDRSSGEVVISRG